MKASDFYVRGRQFFGFLVPGVLWTIALILLILKHKHPIDAVRSVNPSVPLAIGFFLISYAVGRASGNISLSFAQVLSAVTRRVVFGVAWLRNWLRRRAFQGGGKMVRRFAGHATGRAKDRLLGTAASLEHLGGRVLPPAPHEQEQYLSQLEGAVLQILRQQYKPVEMIEAIEALANAEAQHKASRRSSFLGPLFEFCKRILNETTQVLRLALEDKEEEVNFFWMLPLPLFAFAAAWLFACQSAETVPPGSVEVYGRACYVVFTAVIVLAVVFAFHLRPAQLAEKIECYFNFVSFHLTGPEKAEPPATGPRSSVAASRADGDGEKDDATAHRG